MSKYDAAFDQTFGADTPPSESAQPPGKRKYEQVFGEVFGREPAPAQEALPPAKAVLKTVADQDPMKSARAVELSREVGAPADHVARNLLNYELESAVRKADSWLQTDPQVMQRFRESPMFAAQAQKDVEALVKTHGELKGWKVEPTVANTVRGLLSAAPQGLETARQSLTLQLGETLEALGLIERDDVLAKDQMRKAEQARGASEFTTPEFETGTARAVYGGLDSLARLLPGMALSIATRNPTPVLATAGVQTQTDSYVKYRARGATLVEAQLGALGEAGIEVATELLPMKFLSEALGKKGAGDFIAGLLARDVPTEQIATLLQDAVDTAVANPNKTWAEYLQERPEAAYSTFISTITQAGVMAGVNNVMARLGGQTQQIEEAAQAAERLKAAMSAANTVQMRQFANVDFADAMRKIVAEDPDAKSSVYMDAATLMQTVPNAAALFPSVAATLEEAAATGATVELPIADVLAQVPGSTFEAAFLENSRATADGLSLAEARVAQTKAAEWFEAEAQSVMADSLDAAAGQQAFDQIKGEVAQQLNDVGRASPEVNEQFATMIAAMATTMAGRLGMPIQQFWADNRLTISGGKVSRTAATLEQVQPPEGVTIQELPDGTGFEAIKDGKRVGYLKDNLLRGQAQQIDEDANVDIVKVDDSVKGTGVGRALYAAFTAKHDGRVAPSGKTTRDAWAVWKRNNPEAVRKFAEQEAGRILGGADSAMVLGNITDPEVANLVQTALANDGRVSAQIGDVLGQRAESDTRYRDQAIALLAKAKVPKRSSVAMVTGEETPPLLATNFDIARYFTKRNRKGMENPASPQAQKALIDALYVETLQALTEAGSAVGWYDAKVQAALASMAEIHPELATDEQSKFGFLVMLAITSNGTAVNQNFEVAESLYREWKTTGVWPTKTPTSKTGAQMDKGLAQMQQLVALHGWEKMRDFMISEQTVAAVKELTGADVAGELADSTIYGAVFLGSKIGAFFNNLYGNFTPVTMDRWFMRTINRLRGNMLALPANFPELAKRLRDQLGDAALDTYGQDRAAMLAEIDAYEALAPEQQADVLQALKVLPTVTAYSKARLADYSKSGFKARTRENVLAKTINEALTLDEQTPAGGGDRALLRGVMRKLQDRLRSDGIPIEMADLQAVLWYYEKDLFDLLKGKRQQTGLFTEGAKDAEDYATAAARLVRILRGEGAERPGRGGLAGGSPAVRAPRGADARADTTGDLFAQGVTNDAAGTAGQQADAGQVPDGRGLRGGANELGTASRAPAFADQPLAGLPATVTVDGQRVTFGPYLPARRAAEAYATLAGIPYDPPTTYVGVDVARAQRIAEAFDAMEHAPNDPLVAAAYRAMIDETLAQWQAIKATGLVVEFIDGPDPYGNPRNAILDVVNNNHLWVYPTDAGFGGSESLTVDITGNPLLEVVEGETISGRQVRANDIFRIVHDYFGHIKEGVGFRAEGEENAWRAHWAMYSPLARRAMTTETRGQNSWVNFGPFAEFNKTANGAETQYAPQKIGLLPEWVSNEGAADADSAQAEQRRMRQMVDLSVLQKADNETLAQVPEQTSTEQFKAWFGDSKVVDADGKPLVVYHGTNQNITAFDPARIGSRDPGFFGTGFYFTPDEVTAQDYASGEFDPPGSRPAVQEVMPVYLSLQKPFVWDMSDEGAAATRAALAAVGVKRASVRGNSASLGNADERKIFNRVVREQGYDGVIVRDEDGVLEVIAFEPTQIKSAIGNQGTFDPNDPNILRQRPGQVAITGTHFSKRGQTRLDGAFYGTGLRGIERERIANSDDRRLRNRVYFYVDEGSGVRPEAGVGGVAHTAELDNLYDINSDPLKLIVGGDLNATETNVLNAGFDGYYRRDAFNRQGAAVVLGPASRNIPVAQIPNPTTFAPPPAPVAQVYSYGLLAREAAALDIAAIQAVAPSAQLRAGTFRVDPAEFDQAAQAAQAQGVTLPQPRLQQAPRKNMDRGTFNVRTLEIVLTENADLSTFIHEAGHFFLETLMKYGSQVDAPEGVRADAERVLKWFGIESADAWMALDLEGKRPYHERWAESFEQYKLEGKAPTKELEPVFRKFSAFLKDVYKSVKGLMRVAQRRGSDMTLQLNDEIRGVMDRLLAAEAAVQEAEAAIGGPVTQEATDAALEALEARSLRDAKWAANARSKHLKKLQADARETRKNVREEVAADVALRPEVQARKALDALKIVPEHQVLLDQHKAARKSAVEEADAASREAALAEEEARSGSRPAGLKLGQFLAKNKREIANAAERRMIEWDRANPKPLRPVNATDQDMATIADSFGFEDVDAMMTAILEFGSERAMIEALTDQRMLEEYGDLVDDRAMQEAATKAVHSQARAKALATQLAAESAAMNPREDTGRQTADGARVTTNALLDAAKRFAEQIVARTLVRDLRAKRNAYMASEKRAADKYRDATRAGAAAEAIKAKQDQLLNNSTSRSLTEAIDSAQKMIEFLRRVVKDSTEDVVKKGRDADMVNAMRAVLADFGVGTRTTRSAAAYLDTVEALEPETAASLKALVEPLREFAQPIEALSFGQLTELHDAMQAMWYLAKGVRQMEVGGDKIDVQDAADALRARLDTLGVPLVGLGEAGTLTAKEKTMNGLRFARAALTRVEQWADAYGPDFTKYIFRPIKEAADRFRADRVKYRKAYLALLDKIAPTLRPGKIVAPELGGFTFGRGATSGHAELLHAVLHTGNESNKRKLLLGRNWATENPDGTLDTTQWDTFIERMQRDGYLTKVHYDFAQGVWDLLDEIKPLAQKAHREVYGRYFDEVTANSFETPFGAYRGGYVPAQADLTSTADADRAAFNDQNEAMINAFPSAPKGFTMSRVDYNTRLALDLASLGSHIDKVLRFSHMQPAVRGVTRLLKNKTFATPMGKVDNAAVSGLLLPFLNRAARQSAETPVLADGGVMRVVSVVRARAGMGLMMGNLINSVQQLSGFINAGVKVSHGRMAQAAAAFVANPKRFNDAVRGASIFMTDRMANEVGAINEAMDDILLNPTLLKNAQAWTMKHAYFLQAAMDNTMSPIIWTASYNQAIEQGKSHEDAVAEADSTVRTTQTSTLAEDISRAESGDAILRLFTQFANYFNMMANTNIGELVKLANDGGLAANKGRALYVVFVGLLLPVWFAEGVALAMRGGPDDEDDDGLYWDDWITNVMGFGTAKSILAAVPGLGQVAVAGLNRFNDNPMDDRASLSPVVGLLETTAGLPYRAWRLLTGEDQKLRTLVNDLATAITVATGLPARPLARPVGYLSGVAQGEIEPTGVGDFVRGLVTGAPSEESKQ